MNRKLIKLLSALFMMVLSGCDSIATNSDSSSGIIASNNLIIETTLESESATSENSINSLQETSSNTEMDITSIDQGIDISSLPISDIPDAINLVLAGEKGLFYQGEKLASIDELEIYLEDTAEYAVLDFDQDGYNELILHPPVYSYIFRYDGESVYAYQTHYRPMAHIMEDGSFIGSGSATSTYYREFICFTDTDFMCRLYLTVLSCEQTENGYVEGPIYYNESNEIISEDEANAILEKHNDAANIPYRILKF